MEGFELADELRRRKALFLDRSILRDALKDQATSRTHSLIVTEEEWLRENMRVELLDRPNLVQVELADGRPAEQAAIINSVLQAYIRFFEAKDKKELNDRLSQLESCNKGLAKGVRAWETELAKLNDPRSRNLPPKREWRKKLLSEDISNVKGLIQQTAAKVEKIRAAVCKMPAVVEWAQVP